MLLGDISQHDTDVVLTGTVKNVGAQFQNDAGAPADPEALELQVFDISGAEILHDIYYPANKRTPSPPRILNPGVGLYEFPFGLDNGSTSPGKTNKTDQSSAMCDYIFAWNAQLTASTKASVTIDPTTGPNSILTWTAVADGTPGNFISVEYVDPMAPGQSLAVIRNGGIITVSLATNSVGNITTTANDIKNIIPTITVAAEIVTVALATGSTGTDLVGAVAAVPLINGIDGSKINTVYTNVKIVPPIVLSIINKFRLLIDKSMKMINSDPNDPCYLGYTDGQLVQYLTSGFQIINSYQPYGTFTWYNFPYQNYDFILLETSLIAGMMSQSAYAIDTDIPQWNDQGNAFVITHYTQLAQYLNFLMQRLDKLIPQFKLHFVQSGSLHIEAGPNYRLATLLAAAPSGALFRNTFAKVV